MKIPYSPDRNWLWIVGLIFLYSCSFASPEPADISTHTIIAVPSKTAKPKPQPHVQVLKFKPATTHGQILSPGEKAPPTTLESSSSPTVTNH